MSDRRSTRLPIDFTFIGIWLLLALLAISLPVVRESAIRAVIAGSFLLFVPGYALVGALFVTADKLSLPERLVFSVGASFVLVILVGIVLAESPALGISLETVMLSQGLVIVVCLFIGWYRRRNIDPTEQARPGKDLLALTRQAWTERSAVGGGNRAVQVAVVLAVVASAGATAYVVATPLPSEQYTEFYMQGPDGTTETLPEVVGSDEDIELLIGVRNHEHRTHDYGMQVQMQTEDGTSEVTTTDTWLLEHDESREEILSVESPGEGKVEVEVLLFLDDPPNEVVDPDTAHRYVSLTITVESG